MNTPGGTAYRANVHEQGVENPWPPVETVEAQLGSGADTIHVRYRNHVLTLAGETRYSIFTVRRAGGFFESGDLSSLTLYAIDPPPGLELTRAPAGGLPGTLAQVLVIRVSENTGPGEHHFEIGIEVQGQDYGAVPCIVEVIE